MYFENMSHCTYVMEYFQTAAETYRSKAHEHHFSGEFYKKYI